MLALSAALTAWFLLGYQSGGRMHLPALLAAVLTFVLAVGLFVSGLIADGITTNHRLFEEVLYHTRRVEYDRWRWWRTGRLGGDGVRAFGTSLGAGRTLRTARDDGSPQDRDRCGLPARSGCAQFNGAMVRAMARPAPVDVISWRRMYPPLLYRGQGSTRPSPAQLPDLAFMLDWHDPRTWRRAVRRVDEFQADAMILPWLHPLMAPPYRYLLRHVPRTTARVVICHNVVPHEPLPGLRVLSRAALRHADLLVTHAPHQRAELVRWDSARRRFSRRSIRASTRNGAGAGPTDDERRPSACGREPGPAASHVRRDPSVQGRGPRARCARARGSRRSASVSSSRVESWDGVDSCARRQ